MLISIKKNAFNSYLNSMDQVETFNTYHTIKPTTSIQQRKLIPCDVYTMHIAQDLTTIYEMPYVNRQKLKKFWSHEQDVVK